MECIHSRLGGVKKKNETLHKLCEEQGGEEGDENNVLLFSPGGRRIPKSRSNLLPMKTHCLCDSKHVRACVIVIVLRCAHKSLIVTYSQVEHGKH